MHSKKCGRVGKKKPNVTYSVRHVSRENVIHTSLHHRVFCRDLGDRCWINGSERGDNGEFDVEIRSAPFGEANLVIAGRRT